MKVCGAGYYVPNYKQMMHPYFLTFIENTKIDQ